MPGPYLRHTAALLALLTAGDADAEALGQGRQAQHRFIQPELQAVQESFRAIGAAKSLAMADASICGLGQAASNPLTSVMKHFPEDIGRTK